MQKKLNYIDALRGIAVLGVLAVHIGANTISGPLHTLTGLGSKGVQLFYFISAFTLFLSHNGRTSSERHPNISFGIRRLFRIAPLYYLAVIYYAIIIPKSNGNHISIEGILLNLTFTHGFSPTFINSIVPGGWSIATEMLFYLFVPFLVMKINSLSKAFYFSILTLIIKGVFAILLMNNPLNVNLDLWSGYQYWYLPNQLHVFSIGIIFYFLVSPTRNTPQSVLLKEIVVYIFALLTLYILDKIYFKINLLNLDFFLSFGFLAMAFALHKFPVKIVVNAFTEFIGKLSFSMYLVHFTVIYILDRLGVIKAHEAGSIWMFLYNYMIVLLVTIILSMITYEYIELRAQKLGKILIQKLSA